ncbi:MAG: Na+-transporting NADH:ubiquinone oxidoreductase subunit C [Maribacter sp.]|jgi:Na+-transporting NADH:ubiquinone oxidoreductase subunit C
MEKRIDDGTIVDGISGATMTSQSIVKMLNYGLQNYHGYLDEY